MLINNSLVIEKTTDITFPAEACYRTFFVLEEVVDFHIKLSCRVSGSKKWIQLLSQVTTCLKKSWSISMSVIYPWLISTRVFIGVLKKCCSHTEHTLFIAKFSVSIWWTEVFEMCSNPASTYTDWWQSSQIMAATVLFILVRVVAGQPPWEFNVGDSHLSKKFFVLLENGGRA